MLRINNIKIRKNISNENLIKNIARKYHISLSEIINWNISKKSIDARNKNDIFFNYTIDLTVKDESKYPKLQKIKNIDIDYKIKDSLNLNFISSLKKENPPVIIGAGPSGLFCCTITSRIWNHTNCSWTR